MIKELILIAGIGLAPIQKAEDEVQEPQTEEVVEETEIKDEFDWNEWLSKWFSPEQVAMIMSWVAYAGTIAGLIVKLKQLAKSKNTTAEDVKVAVLEEIKKSVNEEVAEQVKPYLDGVIKTQKNTNEVMQVLAKVLALAQVNDPQSRLAILDCIASLGVVDKEVLAVAKETIEQNEQVKEENKNDALEQIDNIIEDTEVETETDDGTSI